MTDVEKAVGDAHRECWGRVLAATLRYTRNLDLAEESTADAFELALRTWPDDGVPRSVEAWLVTASRRRALDRIRRADTLRRKLPVVAASTLTEVAAPDLPPDLLADDELRLLVLCAHPALSATMQVGLMLRLACGVPTAAIAAGFLVATPTMAARLTRAKAQVRSSGASSVELPDDEALVERLPVVRRAVHLAYTLGHTAGSGPDLRADDLAAQAVHLARTLHRARPDPDTTGLLALVLLTEARVPGRHTVDGAQVLLADADRSTWDPALTTEGQRLLTGGPTGTEGYVEQARIAAVHAAAATAADTDWPALVGLYAELLQRDPSPTTAVGRSVALGRAFGPRAGLDDLDELAEVAPALLHYPYFHAARADCLERLGRPDDATVAWRAATAAARNDEERDFFTDRSEQPASAPR